MNKLIQQAVAKLEEMKMHNMMTKGQYKEKEEYRFNIIEATYLNIKHDLEKKANYKDIMSKALTFQAQCFLYVKTNLRIQRYYYMKKSHNNLLQY